MVCSNCSSGLASGTGEKMEARIASADLLLAGNSSGAVRGRGGASSGSTASRSRSRGMLIGSLGAHQLRVKETPSNRAEPPQRAIQQRAVFDDIEPAARAPPAGQRDQPRPGAGSARDLPTGCLEQPADPPVQRAARQDAREPP